MMKTKLFLALAAGAMTILGCDTSDDAGDTASTVGATSMADTGGTSNGDETPATSNGDDSATTMVADSADTMMDSADTAADTAGDTAAETAGAVCDPACAADEECMDGICFPVGGGENPYTDPADGCAGGSIDLNMGIGFNVCGPACDPTAENINAACPDAPGATAVGTCGIISMAVSGPCDMADQGLPCETEGEFCTSADGVEFGCRVGVACVLSCMPPMFECPDGMTCNEMLACVY